MLRRRHFPYIGVHNQPDYTTLIKTLYLKPHLRNFTLYKHLTAGRKDFL